MQQRHLQVISPTQETTQKLAKEKKGGGAAGGGVICIYMGRLDLDNITNMKTLTPVALIGQL